MARPRHTTIPGFDGPALERTREPVAEAEKAQTWDAEPPSRVVLRGEVLTIVPRLAVSTDELMTMPLDHRAGFIASFVDGTFTIEMILDACALPREEALAILGQLAARGVIVV
jgi:hypothetical protein